MAVVVLLLAGWSAATIWYVHDRGWLLYYGDAEAHLKIARRVIDSRTPGYDQLGTVWLPLPHAVMLPFVGDDRWFRSGLAASFPMGACFVLAGTFLFAAVRRLFSSPAAGVAALAIFAANPNVLYLQSTAMTEAPFFASLMALFYFTVRFRETQGYGSLAGAALAALAGTLCRYEGWFLLPFVAGYFLIVSKRRRLLTAAVFCAIAGAGPLYWFAHNWWLTGDALAFYRGPYSARAIQGVPDYPGYKNWVRAWGQLSTAAELCSGRALPWMAFAGVVVAASRRAWWAIVLLALPGLFYLLSMHSSGGTPVFVPSLPPYSYYNTRYGLTLFPLMAVASASLVLVAPSRVRTVMVVLVILAATIQWIVYPRTESWITWKESQVNSEARRAWTREAAAYLAPRYRPGTGIITSFGDISGIFREAGIPFRETFNPDNGLPFEAMVRRPDLHLRHEWAVVMGGDPLQTAIWKGPRFGINYRLVKSIVVKGAPVVEIYRR